MQSPINFGKSITSTPKRPLLTQIGGMDKKRTLTMRSPEGASFCTICHNTTEKHSRINCASCKLQFCKPCTGLSTKAFDLFLSDELDGYKWNCKSCKQTLPTLEQMNNTLKELSIKQDKRLTTLEDQMQNIDHKIGHKINENMSHVKDQITSTLKDEIGELVDARCKEMDDRRRRELNVIVYNLPEAYNENNIRNKQEDETAIHKISTNLGIDNLQVETLYRLGKQKPNSSERPRALKIILKDRKQRKALLENSIQIKNKLQGTLQKAIIVKDLTFEQRQARKDKREKGQSESKHQNKEATAQETTMLMDNINSDYMNTTEATVIGGILSQDLPNEVTSPELSRV